MGSGFKDWSPGDVLTAADVDGYLMRQTVMTFADASARDTALSGVLDEGMMAFLEDTDTLTVYDGSNWVQFVGGWQSFTVSWTNVTVGNGTVVAEYTRVGELIFYRIQLTWGSTTAFTGSIGFDYPLPAAGIYFGSQGGTCHFEATGAGDFPGVLFRNSSTTASIRALTTGGSYVGYAPVVSTVPFTWTTGNILVIEDWYKPA